MLTISDTSVKHAPARDLTVARLDGLGPDAGTTADHPNFSLRQADVLWRHRPCRTTMWPKLAQSQHLTPGGRMKIVTAHRVATLVAATLMALSLTVSLVVLQHGDA